MNLEDDDQIILTRAPKVVTTRGAQLRELQTPVVRVEFDVVPSWNDFLSIARSRGAGAMIEKWRKIGKEKALLVGHRHSLCDVMTLTTYEATKTGKLKEVKTERIAHTPLESKLYLLVRYWRPTWGIYDTFNPFIKPIVDGFVDAGLLKEDNQEFVRQISIEFMGVDAKLAFTEEGKEARRIKRIGKKGSRNPVRARYWFDFYHWQ